MTTVDPASNIPDPKGSDDQVAAPRDVLTPVGAESTLARTDHPSRLETAKAPTNGAEIALDQQKENSQAKEAEANLGENRKTLEAVLGKNVTSISTFVDRTASVCQGANGEICVEFNDKSDFERRSITVSVDDLVRSDKIQTESELEALAEEFILAACNPRELFKGGLLTDHALVRHAVTINNCTSIVAGKGFVVKGQNWDNADLSRAQLENVTFEKTTTLNGVLMNDGAVLKNVRIAGQAAGLQANNLVMDHRSSFKGANLDGWSAEGAVLMGSLRNTTARSPSYDEKTVFGSIVANLKEPLDGYSPETMGIIAAGISHYKSSDKLSKSSSARFLLQFRGQVTDSVSDDVVYRGVGIDNKQKAMIQGLLRSYNPNFISRLLISRKNGGIQDSLSSENYLLGTDSGYAQKIALELGAENSFVVKGMGDEAGELLVMTKKKSIYLVPLSSALEDEDEILRRLNRNSFQRFNRQEVGKARAKIVGFMRGNIKLDSFMPIEYHLSRSATEGNVSSLTSEPEPTPMSRVEG